MSGTEDEKEIQDQVQDQAAPNDDALDLDTLDLSVETAEERISPSETNVFDK